MSTQNHPKAIRYLFLTEMWERFSYYGITALLILYMAKTFGISEGKVYAIYGAYGALVYMTPLIGGYFADRFLGSFNAVVIGSIFIAVGHFVVACRAISFHFFYLGLAIIIVGTGLFSPNINAIVGHLYKDGDNRRDRGFTLAYMGRNIGTILAPIVCAYIAMKYDWRLAFIVAGVGMLVGLYTFNKGKVYFNPKSFKRELDSLEVSWVFISLVLLTAVIFFVIEHLLVVGPLLLVTVLVMLVTLTTLALKEDRFKQKRMFVAMILTAFYIVFMILLQQSGGALNLFTDRYVDRSIWGVTIDTGMFQSVEPLALVILSPFYNKMWFVLAERRKVVSYGLKFVFGLLLMSLSFVLLAFAMPFHSKSGLISMHWLNAAYLFQAAGELFIGPIGLAMVSHLIPRNILGLYMGFWVLASAIANFLAAKIGAVITPHAASVMTAGGELSPQAMYQHAFWQLAAFGLISTLLLWLLLPWIKRLMGQDDFNGMKVSTRQGRENPSKPLKQMAL